MNRVKWERFKFYVLITLVLAGLIQVGILWNSQNHGFPYYFFSDLLSKKEVVDIKDVKYGFFSPYRIVVSQGFDEAHWIIGKSDKYYKILFNEANTYILDILSDRIKSDESITLTGEELGKLAVKPSVSVEFKTGISKELLAFFLDIKDVSSCEFASVKKIVILPDHDLCTIAIVDDINKKIYEYTSLPYQKPDMGRKYYEDLFKEFSTNPNLINYGVIKELKMSKEKSKGLAEDIPFVARSASKYYTYKTISCSPPKEFQFEIRDSENAEDLMPLAQTILLNEKDNYIPSIDIYGAAVFKNVGSVYRVYRDGLLEYKYSSSSQEEIEKGSISDAFIKALAFIKTKKGLIDSKLFSSKSLGVEVFLSGVDETRKDRYRFTFDYNVDEVPVFFNYQANDKGKTLLKNAITIEATGDRILNCWWIFKDFIAVNEHEYNVYLMDLLEYGLANEDNFMKNIKNLSIKDIGVCYKVTGKDDFKEIDPEWLIDMANSDAFTVKMRKK